MNSTEQPAVSTMGDKTDSGLMALAAKAVGLNYEPMLGGYYTDPEFNEVVSWNPLTNDGDALRLVVALRLRVETNAETAWAVALGPSMEPWALEHIGADPAAATRRAIVRAAASISKKKEGVR